MESQSINNGLLTRYFYVTLFRCATSKYFRCFFKHTNGVVFVSPNLCIKSTYFTTLSEAQTMLFISQRTKIPVPKIYSAFEIKGRVYIVMERIRGQSLVDGWVQRSEESKSQLLRELRSMIEEMRLISPVTGGVANVCGGPIHDAQLPGHSAWGPFPTIREFHNKLRKGINTQHLPNNSDSKYPGMAELINFHNQSWPHPVFTHGDLSSLNILAQGNKIVGIIDWETAGWMPQYWEYTSAWHVNPQNEFWREEVGKFLTPFSYELDMEIVRRKYFGDI